MARYIDLDKAIERLKASPAFPNMGTDGYFLLDLVEDLLNKQPSVDVVPMVEVRRLQETVECQRKVIDEVRAEFARKIFEEIYEDCFDQFGYIDYNKLDELKKKHTEGGAERSGSETDEKSLP